MSHSPPAHLAVDFAAAGIRDAECLFPDMFNERERWLAESGAWERRSLVARA